MYRSHQHTALSLVYTYTTLTVFLLVHDACAGQSQPHLSILKRRGDSFHGCNILPPFEWIYYIDTQKYFYNALT